MKATLDKYQVVIAELKALQRATTNNPMHFLEPIPSPVLNDTTRAVCSTCNRPEPCPECVRRHSTHNDIINSSSIQNKTKYGNRICSDCGHLLSAFKDHRKKIRGSDKSERQCTVDKGIWNTPCTDVDCSQCSSIRVKNPNRTLFHPCPCEYCTKARNNSS